MSGSVSIAHIMSFNNQEVKSLLKNRSVSNFNSFSNLPVNNHNKNTLNRAKKEEDMEDILEEVDDEVYGDISEPFLIQASLKNHSNGGNLASTTNLYGASANSTANQPLNSSSLSPQWIDPDDFFIQNYGNQLINMADKRMFWEMVSVICEYKEIQTKCHSPLVQFNVLCDTIKRKEFKILWTKEGVDMIPKKLALEFIKASYL